MTVDRTKPTINRTDHPSPSRRDEKKQLRQLGRDQCALARVLARTPSRLGEKKTARCVRDSYSGSSRLY